MKLVAGMIAVLALSATPAMADCHCQRSHHSRPVATFVTGAIVGALIAHEFRERHHEYHEYNEYNEYNYYQEQPRVVYVEPTPPPCWVETRYDYYGRPYSVQVCR
jgi:hypothetical protein